MDKKTRYFEVKIITNIECETIKQGEMQVRDTFSKPLPALKIHALKCLQDIRTIKQNDSLHLWFDQIEVFCMDNGITMDMLIKNPAEIIVTKELLKKLFQLITDSMFQIKKTSKLDKLQLDKVIKTFQLLLVKRIGCSIPFPSIDVLINNDNQDD